MNIFEAIILGLIQGLTEFLPVSSSGHLVLLQQFFAIDEGVITFNIAVHFATLLAVFLVFWKDIIEIIKRPFSKLSLLIIVGTIPTAVIGLIFKDTFEGFLQTGSVLGYAFLFTGLILWYAETVKNKDKGLNETTYVDTIVIGIAQGIAILPGVSRSGLTLAGALTRGLDRRFALKISFLMSMPSILGATLLEALDIAKQPYEVAGIVSILAGMVAAGISGYLAIRFMLKIFEQKSLKIFSYYVFGLGAIIILDGLLINRIIK